MPTICSHALEELSPLEPERGEEETLAARRQLMMNAEKIAAELAEAPRCAAGRGHQRRAARGGAAADRAPGCRCRPDLLAPVAEALERVLTDTNTARAKIEEALG